MKPLISIIMPVYNCEDYVEESIRSILEQTYEHLELIIVNDSSEDHTKGIIAKIKDSRVQTINLEKHLGIADAFNKGYKLAKGQYIVRQDGDDISAVNRLELQEAYLSKTPDSIAVSCLISCFTREPLFRKDCIFIERIQNNYVNYEDIKKAVLGGFIPVLFPTLMIRKDVLDKLPLVRKGQSLSDHIELFLDLLQKGKINKISSLLYHYRRHKNAYHIVNELEYEKYSLSLLNNSTMKNHLKYQDFYKNFNMQNIGNFKVNEKSPIRVLMLIDALNIGGTETHVLNIVKRLMDMGIYVVLATSGGPMEGVLESFGIKIINIPFESDYISNKKKMGMIKLLKKIIDDEKINVIHCHLFASMQLASELYRIYKFPYIVTIHGLFYPNDVLYSSCIKANYIIAVSEPVRKMLTAKLGEKIHNKLIVIPNGVSMDQIKSTNLDLNIEKELDIPQSGKIICYCSRLDWNKTEAARVFIFSLSKLVTEFSDLYAVIIGDGSGKESLEKEAEIINQMAGKKVVHVVGAKANVIPYFVKSSIVIGTARVALEAMMCRKPVIAIGNQGYTGLINERNKDRQWQMYFGDHDALEKPNVSKLTKDIEYLLLNPERCMALGDFGRSWCEKMFNNDKIVDEIIKIYKKASSQ